MYDVGTNNADGGGGHVVAWRERRWHLQLAVLHYNNCERINVLQVVYHIQNKKMGNKNLIPFL